MMVIACSTAAFSQNDDKANVLAVERTLADAFTKHNVVNINAIYADDASIIKQQGELVNKQQLTQYVQQVNSFVLSDLQVKLKGSNIAIVTGIQSETGKDASGNVYSTKSRFTDGLEKKNGSWTIAASQSTVIQ